MAVNYSKILSFFAGAVLLPVVLPWIGPETAILILAPAMFFWISIPLMVVALLLLNTTGNRQVKSVGNHCVVAFGGLLLTSALLLAALVAR